MGQQTRHQQFAWAIAVTIGICSGSGTSSLRAQEAPAAKVRPGIQPPAYRASARPELPHPPTDPRPNPHRHGGSLPGEGLERINHLRVAAENLTLAGFEREGAELRERAARLEEDLIRNRPELVSERLIQELRELRESVQLLREDVQLLRRELQQMAAGDEREPRVPAAGKQTHEGRIRLPDRGARIPDEVLDAPLREPGAVEPSRTAAKRPAENAAPENDVEFELVPVPVDPATSEPVPTPATP